MKLLNKIAIEELKRKEVFFNKLIKKYKLKETVVFEDRERYKKLVAELVDYFNDTDLYRLERFININPLYIKTGELDIFDLELIQEKMLEAPVVISKNINFLSNLGIDFFNKHSEEIKRKIQRVLDDYPFKRIIIPLWGY